MSHLEVYGYDLRIYRGIYRGVPTVDIFCILLVRFCFANPKSPILMTPLLINRLAGFISLTMLYVTDVRFLL